MKIKVLLSVLACSGLMSCSDLLDKEPLDIISEAQVWSDTHFVKGNLMSLYAAAPTRRLFSYGFALWGGDWMDGTLEPAQEPGQYVTISDEAVSAYTWSESHLRNHQVVARNDKYLAYWDYKLIRNCNEFLEKIELGSVAEEDKQAYIGEARFLRAFVYFEMVKRYGGVPLILKAQQLTDPKEELYPSRNTEKECYDFIISECRDIADNFLPEVSGEAGRVNKYTALSLLSRSALYAGSVAKYGEVQLDGVVGIASENAADYFKKSLEASNEVVSGPYSLYNQNSDKVENYRMLFMDGSSANTEIIFARQFVDIDKGHSFDYFSVIQGYGSGWGSCINPTLDMVEAYDMVDGSSGKIDWANETRPMVEVLKDKDPRMHATVVYDGCPYGDVMVEDYIVESKIAGSYKLLNNAPNEWKTWNVNGEEITIKNTGNDTYSAAKGDATKSGFYMRKFINFDNLRINAKQSGTDWLEFRLGEILLNQAEAAFEVGETATALTAINTIRERAGVAAHSTIDMAKIRAERRVELAFECHRLWDMMRWRTANEDLNKSMKGVAPIRRMPENTYRYEVFCCDSRTDNLDEDKPRYFNPDRMYYTPLGEVICNNNPNIVENPNY